MSGWGWGNGPPKAADLRRRRRQALGRRFPSTINELKAIAAASDVPVTRPPAGPHYYTEWGTAQVSTLLMPPTGSVKMCYTQIANCV